MNDRKIGDTCKWCNGTGNDGSGVCPDCECTGITGGKLGARVLELMADVSHDVYMERKRQNATWGIQRHDYGTWLAILVEEVGEAAQAINRLLVPAAQKETDADNLYVELVQTAAVAMAIAEQVREEQERGRMDG